jgi:hypothetical protein
MKNVGPSVAASGARLPVRVSRDLSSPATPLTRDQARALAIDMSRRSTPADGGFCTFQPVVYIAGSRKMR